jgi:hypothetical protein
MTRQARREERVDLVAEGRKMIVKTGAGGAERKSPRHAAPKRAHSTRRTRRCCLALSFSHATMQRAGGMESY